LQHDSSEAVRVVAAVALKEVAGPAAPAMAA
jgi:hypothetical protein